MAKVFTNAEWDSIYARLSVNETEYGFPTSVYGSVLIGSFNIRKLGRKQNRNRKTWEFLAMLCRQFDLLAIQEVMDDLEGLKHLMELLGPDFGLVASDMTGVFPGDSGVAERLAFIFKWSTVKRDEIVSDVTYDRSKIVDVLLDKKPELIEAYKKYQVSMKRFNEGKRKTKPNFKLPMFLSFIRQPFCVSFRIVGQPSTEPYKFMAVNAHLIFGVLAPIMLAKFKEVNNSCPLPHQWS